MWLLSLGSSVLLDFEVFSFHENFHRYPFAPDLSLGSRLFSGFDFVFALDFVSPIFLRASVSPWWMLGFGCG